MRVCVPVSSTKTGRSAPPPSPHATPPTLSDPARWRSATFFMPPAHPPLQATPGACADRHKVASGLAFNWASAAGTDGAVAGRAGSRGWREGTGRAPLMEVAFHGALADVEQACDPRLAGAVLDGPDKPLT